jgi:hypothetical protein
MLSSLNHHGHGALGVVFEMNWSAKKNHYCISGKMLQGSVVSEYNFPEPGMKVIKYGDDFFRLRGF